MPLHLRTRLRDRALADELNGYVELAIQTNRRPGITLKYARPHALSELGGVVSTSQQCRESKGLPSSKPCSAMCLTRVEPSATTQRLR